MSRVCLDASDQKKTRAAISHEKETNSALSCCICQLLGINRGSQCREMEKIRRSDKHKKKPARASCGKCSLARKTEDIPFFKPPWSLEAEKCTSYTHVYLRDSMGELERISFCCVLM